VIEFESVSEFERQLCHLGVEPYYYVEFEPHGRAEVLEWAPAIPRGATLDHLQDWFMLVETLQFESHSLRADRARCALAAGSFDLALEFVRGDCPKIGSGKYGVVVLHDDFDFSGRLQDLLEDAVETGVAVTPDVEYRRADPGELSFVGPSLLARSWAEVIRDRERGEALS
jgi:hypothetical protein